MTLNKLLVIIEILNSIKMFKSFLQVGMVIVLFWPSLPVKSNDNIKRNNLINDMVEKRGKSGKEMKVTMDEFWEELKETRKIKYGYDMHFEKNLDYCRHFAEISVIHREDEVNEFLKSR
mgnify:CR=1 FL=1